MKPKLYSILVFFLLGMYVQAQIKDNSVWTEYSINTFQNNSIAGKYQYQTAGDTIINSRTYKKIVDKYGYVGSIREENGKVYAKFKYWEDSYGWEEESLLYDYTVQVGDIITSTAPTGALSLPLTVARIDEVTLVTGEKRKLFVLYGTGEWIEGIGSIYGLFHDAMEHATNGVVNYLVCFKQGDEILYRNDDKCQSTNCCAYDPNVSVINILSSSKSVIYSENNQIIIHFPETFSGETTIRLYDVTGCLFAAKTTGQNSFELNIFDYHQGIYLIAIQNGNNVEYFKLIK